jgi:hypothetical protein
MQTLFSIKSFHTGSCDSLSMDTRSSLSKLLQPSDLVLPRWCGHWPNAAPLLFSTPIYRQILRILEHLSRREFWSNSSSCCRAVGSHKSKGSYMLAKENGYALRCFHESRREKDVRRVALASEWFLFLWLPEGVLCFYVASCSSCLMGAS